ncbi:MAG: phage holin family protein [Clostridium saudiense]|uniref:phage holin family protein n=1 Tax=Clostridium saudiense TaxID=1414720 RepID=UPI0021FB8269|nr:phage holin family protein [Clostridium saudiense]MDU3522192.1 phage holin family protein [Clostridium saudiense]UVX78377.1 MAG: holin [Bacteriophage sp.]
MENIVTFIPEQLFILIAASYVLGIFLKKIESVKDKYITIILMLFCIILSMVLDKFTNIPMELLQGILCWGASVGINQTGKQLLKQE